MLPENVANEIKVASFSLLALPHAVRCRVQQGIFQISQHNNVSILYSDIKGFTSWSAERSASECACVLTAPCMHAWLAGWLAGRLIVSRARLPAVDDVVKLLSDLFTLFDKATRVNNIYKLQTCGLLGGVWPVIVGNCAFASVQDRRRVCVRVGSGIHAAGSSW